MNLLVTMLGTSSKIWCDLVALTMAASTHNYQIPYIVNLRNYPAAIGCKI